MCLKEVIVESFPEPLSLIRPLDFHIDYYGVGFEAYILLEHYMYVSKGIVHRESFLPDPFEVKDVTVKISAIGSTEDDVIRNLKANIASIFTWLSAREFCLDDAGKNQLFVLRNYVSGRSRKSGP